MNNWKSLYKILQNQISKLKWHKEFYKNPKQDFTRNRKLKLETIINLLLCMEAGSLKDELYKYFDLNQDNPTASALIQQRQKIKIVAFEWLLKKFTNKTRQNKKYKGYRLLAVDGSSVPISYDINDKETYIVQTSNKQKEAKGYNAFHLSAVYDLLEHTYEDIIIQGEAKMNENGAFNDFVDKYNDEKAIFIADRGYESYNSFAHVIENKQKFLIRVKDIHSKTSLTRSLNLKNQPGEFDIIINRILTPKQTNEIKSQPEKYKFIPNNQRFDYLNKESPYYEIEFRIVRFKLSNGNYECIATNLSNEEFSIEEIKELYNKRWGIETSFRELKYAVAMNAFHSKRRDLIKQEILIKILFYNFSERVIQNIKPKQKKRKYKYQLNFTRAFHLIRFVLNKIKSGIKPPNIESIIEKEIEPVRPDRSSHRKVRHQTPVFFIYR